MLSLARPHGRDSVTWFPAPGTQPAGCEPPWTLMVAVGRGLVSIVVCMIDFMFLLWEMLSLPGLLGNILPAKVDDSMIIRNNISLGRQDWFSAKEWMLGHLGQILRLWEGTLKTAVKECIIFQPSFQLCHPCRLATQGRLWVFISILLVKQNTFSYVY